MNLKAHLAMVNDITELKKKYTIGRELGRGITGTVNLCTSKVMTSRAAKPR
jgi:hypothetical protein